MASLLSERLATNTGFWGWVRCSRAQRPPGPARVPWVRDAGAAAATARPHQGTTSTMPIMPLSSWLRMWQWKTNLPVKS